ncbi:MAG: type III pantothenate kinase, partial [Planctomycetota bacterium]
MHIVAVDIGNSSTKFALAVPNRLENDLDIIRVSNHEFDVTENLSCFLNFAGPITWSICSVNRTIESMVVDWVSTYRCDDSIFAISESDIPIPSDIQCRKSLGTDRLLASWFSTVLTPRLPIVVVDSGTAVTIDVVNEDGVFAGGFIFPGIEKSLKVLNESTDALPDLVAMQANSIADYSV